MKKRNIAILAILTASLGLLASCDSEEDKYQTGSTTTTSQTTTATSSSSTAATTATKTSTSTSTGLTTGPSKR